MEVEEEWLLCSARQRLRWRSVVEAPNCVCAPNKISRFRTVHQQESDDYDQELYSKYSGRMDNSTIFVSSEGYFTDSSHIHVVERSFLIRWRNLRVHDEARFITRSQPGNPSPLTNHCVLLRRLRGQRPASAVPPSKWT